MFVLDYKRTLLTRPHVLVHVEKRHPWNMCGHVCILLYAQSFLVQIFFEDWAVDRSSVCCTEVSYDAGPSNAPQRLPSYSHKTHTRYQFKDLSLSLAKGQKVGLVGVNGCGKSTLLRCIGGVEKAESGEIETLKGLTVVYVDQEPTFTPGLKVKVCSLEIQG